MRRAERNLAWLVPLCAAVLAACSVAPRQPPGAPPSPSSVSREEPGGDAHDPHAAALRRQLSEPWGFRRDKDHQLIIPLADPAHHKRVRFWAVDHFLGFRYGKDYHVLNVVFVQDVPEGTPTDSRTCIRQAEKWGRPQLRGFEVKLRQFGTLERKWRRHEIVVKTVDGYVDFGLERREFSAAYAAYPAYPGACLVFAIAVPWREHEKLAKQVRDRWVDEGVPRVIPLTKTRPYRK